MLIDNGIAGLELVYHFVQRDFAHTPALLWDDHDVVLCDTGMPGLLPELKKQMEALDVPFESINKIIISHHDIDHIGNLKEIKKLLPQAKVYASAVEKPYIEGKKPAVKSLENTLRGVPEEHKKDFDDPYGVTVDETVKGGEVLPFCGGVEIIDTPGHCPGHISLLHRKSRTLISNDAVCFLQGKIVAPFNTPDLPKAYDSIRRLARMDYDQILFYHGGFQGKGIHKELEDFAKTLH